MVQSGHVGTPEQPLPLGLPEAVQGRSEITDLYVKKFGRPPLGSWVFIWMRQVINSREAALKRTCADMPPAGEATQRQGCGTIVVTP